jgi:hypothetical protein
VPDVAWQPYPASPVDGRHAVVDYTSGTVRLPQDDHGLDPAQERVVQTADDYLMVQCLTAKGYGDQVAFVGPAYVPDLDDHQSTYGLWSDADAANGDYSVLVARGYFEYGWAGQGGNDTRNDGANSSGQEGQDFGDCLLSVAEALRGMTQAEWTQTPWYQGTASGIPTTAIEHGHQAWLDASLDPAAVTGDLIAQEVLGIVHEWEQCITTAGLTPSPHFILVPDGVFDANDPAFQPANRDNDTPRYTPDAPPAVQLSPQQAHDVAAIDVRCKQQVGVVQRIGDIDAAITADHISANPDYWASIQEISARMLANAQTILAEAHVTM